MGLCFPKMNDEILNRESEINKQNQGFQHEIEECHKIPHEYEQKMPQYFSQTNPQLLSQNNEYLRKEIYEKNSGFVIGIEEENQEIENQIKHQRLQQKC